jgi:hypothetical protein
VDPGHFLPGRRGREKRCDSLSKQIRISALKQLRMKFSQDLTLDGTRTILRPRCFTWAMLDDRMT